jgi:uncharacterized protein YajQ (UPF0234 family)
MEASVPSFDISSEVDQQEIRNAVDQASREIANRFDFKNTDSSIELGTNEITMRSVSADRLTALRQVLEEKLVRRQVSMKAVSYGTVEDAAGGTVRQVATLVAGINADKAKELNKFIKGLGMKGIQSQTQGEEVRVIAKKRDDLQAVIQACKEHDFEIPLQFGNFRD